MSQAEPATSAPHLEARGADCWTIDHGFRLGLFELGTRTTLVRLEDGGLVVLSPGPIDDLRAAGIEKLGPVAALVAPNTMHYVYLGECARAFPDARVLAVPGLRKRLPDLAFESLDAAACEAWSGQLEQIAIEGAPSIEEVVFFHPKSRTLVVTDLVFNFQSSTSLATRLLMRVNGAWQRLGPSRLFKSFLRDKPAVRASIDRILEWDFDRIVLTHGEVCETGGHEALRRAYAWLP